MFSKVFRFINAMSVASPILLSVWVVNTIQKWSNLHFYFKISEWSSWSEFLKAHWTIMVFAGFCSVIYYYITLSLTQLPYRPFIMKKSKSVDTNFTSLIISGLLPFSKFLWKDQGDTIYLWAVLVAWIVLSLIMMKSYQFNVIVALMGYRYYEVESVDDFAYLVLSKRKIINKMDMKAYVPLTDHMIINAN